MGTNKSVKRMTPGNFDTGQAYRWLRSLNFHSEMPEPFFVLPFSGGRLSILPEPVWQILILSEFVSPERLRFFRRTRVVDQGSVRTTGQTTEGTP
jgi:hypothetical protein